MEESKFKKLLEKSEIKTSDNFIPELLNKLEALDKESPKIHFPFIQPLFITGFLLVVIGFVFLKFGMSFSLIETYSFSFKYPVMIVLSIFLIWSLDRFIRLKKESNLG